MSTPKIVSTARPVSSFVPRATRPRSKAIVVGGGIAGLASGLALRQAGLEVALFERAPRIEQVGAGIGLALNALRCLDRLGVGNSVRRRGQSAPKFVHRTASGDLLVEYPWQGVWIHRADLQDALLAALGEDVVQLDSTFAGFTQDLEGVTVRFSNGHEERGDVLLGADGIRSGVRTELFGESRPRYTGSIAWRGVANFDHPDLVSNLEFWGRGSRFGVFQIGRGRTYWYGTRRVPEGFAIPGERRKPDLLRHYGDWFEPVAAVIEATEDESIIQTDIYDRRPIRRWGEGRVTLVGDSAHAMTADAGQGCAQVIEDAIVIGDCLGASNDVQAALRAYERLRMKRANAVLRRSHRYSQISRLKNPIVCGVRNSLFLKRMPEAMRRRRRTRLLGFSAD